MSHLQIPKLIFMGEVYMGEFNSESWDSSADIATGYGLDGWGSIFGRVKRFFSSPRRSGPLSPHTTDNGGSSQGVQRLGREADHLPHLVSRSRMMELYLHFPRSLHAVVLNYKIN
jgi:hypothetical protein